MGEWQPIQTAPHMRSLLVVYQGRVIRARYYDPRTLEIDEECDIEEDDYDPDTEQLWAREGWFEEHDHADAPLPRLSEPPTRWILLPEPPKWA